MQAESQPIQGSLSPRGSGTKAGWHRREEGRLCEICSSREVLIHSTEGLCVPPVAFSYSCRSFSFLPRPLFIQPHFFVYRLRSTEREPGGGTATTRGLLTRQGLVQMQPCLETPAGSDASILNHQLPLGTWQALTFTVVMPRLAPGPCPGPWHIAGAWHLWKESE